MAVMMQEAFQPWLVEWLVPHKDLDAVNRDVIPITY